MVEDNFNNQKTILFSILLVWLFAIQGEFFRRFILHMMLCAIWYHLYNLKIVKNIHEEVLLWVKFQALKASILHGCFSRFLNYTNGTKLCKASQMITVTIHLLSLLINLKKSKIVFYRLSWTVISLFLNFSLLASYVWFH